MSRMRRRQPDGAPRRSVGLRLARCGLTALCGLTLAAWLGSAAYWFYVSNGASLTLHGSGGVGVLHVYSKPMVRATYFACGRKEWGLRRGQFPTLRPIQLWTVSPSTFGGPTTITLPLSLPFIFMLLPTAAMWLWPHRHRRTAGQCLGCGYNLTGNTSGVCPECGLSIDATIVR